MTTIQASMAEEFGSAPACVSGDAYRPSTPTVDSPLLIHAGSPTLVCPACGNTMKVSRTIPKLGGRPEQLIFICPSCKEVAAKRYLWRDILKMRRRQAAHSVKTNDVSQRVTATDANANPVAN